MGRNPGSRRDKDYPLMDSLRALGAIGVLTVHAMHVSATLPADAAIRDYVLRLDIAVPMFFAMSGFLLYRPFVRAHLGGEKRPDVGDYGWRRVLRIVPGYWVALTLVALWIGLSEVFTAGGVLSYYGFAQIYRAETFDGGMVQAWTIAVEVVFYATLPLYVLLIQRLLRSRPPAQRLRGEVAGVCALFAIGMAYNVVALALLDPISEGQGPILFAFPAFVNQFAIGMGLAIWSVRAEARERDGSAAGRAVSVIDRWPVVPMAVVLAAYLFLVHGLALQEGVLTDGEWLTRHLLNTLIAGALLLPTIFFTDVRRGLVRRLLATRALVYLGVISYGFYLYHLAVLTQLERWGLTDALGSGYGTYAAWVALGVAGSAALGALSWHLLERRSLQQIRRIRRWRSDRAPEASEPARQPEAAVSSDG